MSSIYDLVIQIFMATSLIAGVVMLVFTIGYRSRLRRLERLVRYVLGLLLIYSVVIRFLILLPGRFTYMKESSLVFDAFYIALCLFYNISILGRRNDR